jgi:hypothetical protein
MADDIVGAAGWTGWRLDPVTATALRLELARKALLDGDPQRCAIEAEEVLDDEPGHSTALWLLAVSASDLGDVLTAREAWRELARIEGRALHHTAFALAAYETAQFEDAETAARAALAKDTDQAHAWWVIGRCAERRGAAAEAQDAFLQAHLRSPHQCIVPLAPPTDGWQPIIDAAFDQIDDTTGALWREIGLEVLDFPDEALLLDAVPPLPPGLLVFGVPYEGDRYEGDAPDSPAGLRVYVGNLAHAASFADAADRLADALEEEAANWGIHDDEE